MELPDGVKRELRWASSFLPLLWTDLKSEWDDIVTATDASEEGAADACATWRRLTWWPRPAECASVGDSGNMK